MKKAARVKFFHGYKVVGKTKDGIRILLPKAKSINFTIGQLRKAIKEVNKKQRSC